MAYCTIDDIRRTLRVAEPSLDNAHKIRFSDSYSIPEAYSSNSGNGVLLGITSIPTDYAGSEFWKIKFTSATAFTLYRGQEEKVNDGSGTISSNFTSNSGIITVNTDKWSGSFVTGDQFKFKTDSIISTDDAESFISDADSMIDGMLNRYIDASNLPLFTSIPDHSSDPDGYLEGNLIKRASMYIASNLIFTSAFSNFSPDRLPTIVRRWYTFGRNLVNMYLETIVANETKKFLRHGRFVAREPLFDKVGISEVAGVEGMYGEREALDVDYDKDYNTKEAIGTT